MAGQNTCCLWHNCYAYGETSLLRAMADNLGIYCCKSLGLQCCILVSFAIEDICKINCSVYASSVSASLARTTCVSAKTAIQRLPFKSLLLIWLVLGLPDVHCLPAHNSCEAKQIQPEAWQRKKICRICDQTAQIESKKCCRMTFSRRSEYVGNAFGSNTDETGERRKVINSS